MTPKCSAQALSSVPKCNKVLMYLMEKIHAFDEFLSTLGRTLQVRGGEEEEGNSLALGLRGF